MHNIASKGDAFIMTHPSITDYQMHTTERAKYCSSRQNLIYETSDDRSHGYSWLNH